MRYASLSCLFLLAPAHGLSGCGDAAAGSDGGAPTLGEGGYEAAPGAPDQPLVPQAPIIEPTDDMDGGTTDGSVDGGVTDAGDGAIACDYVEEDHFVFGVTQGSIGAAGTDVRTQSDASEHTADLFATDFTGAHAPGNAGENSLVLDEAALGLAADDELDAVSFGPFVPEPRILHFSLRNASGVAGRSETAVRQQWETEVFPGDVFASSPHADDTDTDNDNTLEVDEIEAALEPHDLTDKATDDLDALDFSPVPTDGPIYFSLARSTGTGTGGAAIRVSRNGTVKPLLSAADLGLKSTDELDALVVLDADADADFGAGDSVLFSVSLDSEGADGTDVQRQARLGEVGGDIFVSAGDGTNQLYRDQSDLGLLDHDDVDALEVTSEAPECGCGDGRLDTGEQCEVGIPCANAADTCLLATCECVSDPPPFCGDGVLNWPEQCEFPFHCPGWPFFPVFCGGGCRCALNPVCGNGIRDAGEACDLGVFGGGVPCANPSDVCSPGCTCDASAYCGDGVLDLLMEECDPGAAGFFGGFTGPNVPCSDSAASCTADCRCIKGPAEGFCGDLVRQAFEECERNVPCDAADETCDPFECVCRRSAQFCDPDGQLGRFEGCDPLRDPSGCPDGASCNEACACVTVPTSGGVCGDGLRSPGEACDLVWGGQGQRIPFGCAEGDTCDAETCTCGACGLADSTTSAIPLAGGVAPTCALNHGGIDACDTGHWHGSAIVLDTDTCAMHFEPDPAPSVCGHGKDTDLVETATTIAGKCLCDLYTAVPCTLP